MGVLKFNYKKVDVSGEYKQPNVTLNTLRKEDFRKFNLDILDLGDLTRDGEYINALAAIFDLEGFSSFCYQPDSHLVLPEFMHDFLEWLFSQIANHFKEKEEENLVRIWGSLPFSAKFTGDGILFLWDTDYSGGMPGIGNIAQRLIKISDLYESEFYIKKSMSFTQMPKRLRIGIARGQIISLGDGRDYVGPCINIASRLQKLSQLKCAILRKGFNPGECFAPSYSQEFVTKIVDIPGISKDELVILRRKDFNELPPKEKEQFRELKN
jgi:hypothetical protein